MSRIVPAPIIGQSAASGAQVIDGSLKFDSVSKNYLERDFSSDGNRKTWTWSSWIKKSDDEGFSEDGVLFESRIDSPGSTDANIFGIRWRTNGRIIVYDTGNSYIGGSREFRDTNAFYHLVLSVDTTQASNNISLYVNGDLYLQGSYTQNSDTRVNDNDGTHRIGARTTLGSQDGYFLSSQLSQTYFIDGVALGPENFGFTDPLTNTWRPKKYTGTFQVAEGIPTVSNGGLVIKADGASINGTFGVSGGVKTWTSPDGVTWTRNGSGRSSAAAKYLAVGGAGTALRTFYPDAGSGGFTFYMYNGGGEFDGSSSPFTLDLSSQTYLSSQTTSVGKNGFYLPFDGSAAIGQDQSGNGNDFTPVRFGNTNKIDSPDLTGGTPILNTNEAGTVALPGYRSDPNASNLVVALPLVGAEGGTSFNDIAYQIKGSGSSKAFTAFTGNSDGGGTTSTRGFVLYGSSFYTTRGGTNNNTGDYIERTGDSDLSMGTGDYCIEFWYHPYNYTTNDVLIDTRHPTTDWPSDDNGIMIYVNANGDVAMVSNGVQISGSGVVGKNQDNHFALTREGTTERLFVNGNLVGTATNRTNDYNRDRLHLGSSAPNGEGSSGYYNDLRVYKGIAKYTSSFKVGSPNPTVLPDTPSGVSGGSKLTKITDGAVSFDGSGDYLSVTGPGTLAASSNWCMECFFYCTGNSSGTYRIMGANESAQSSEYLQMRIRLGQYQFYTDNANTLTGTAAFNKWTHMALTKSGTTVRAFVDGKQLWSTTDNNADDITTLITGWGYGGEYFPGFISNARFVNGSSVYTADFTPPTSPLTNITNTHLLCCQSNTSAIAATVKPADIPWLPTGYTYWTAGMSQNWAGSGGTTSNTSDYINVALPTSGKYYWETTINNLGLYRVMGISTGAAGVGANYTDNIFGFYYNGNPPLFLVRNASGTNRNASGVTHGANVGSPNWQNGDKIMWAWDADNDKIYMGLNGTWYNSGDPVAGTGNIIAGEDLSASSYYFKLGYTADGGTLTLTTVTSGNSGSSSSLSKEGDAAATNFNPFNTSINTVRGQETGYCTLNPLNNNGGTLSNGNLSLTHSGAANVSATFKIPTTGKYYWEYLLDRQVGGGVLGIGDGSAMRGTGLGNWIKIYGYSPNGNKYEVLTSASYGATLATGDLVGVKYDADTRELEFLKNNISQGVAYTVSGDYDYYPSIHVNNSDVTANFGQKPFKFPPPDGFQPLNAANVRPETVIARPDQYVGVTTYTGDGNSSGRHINIGFRPDLIWLKSRGSGNHGLYDSVRGPDKRLQSDSTAGEGTVGFPGASNFGFDFGSETYYNASSTNYVAWTWKAGGNKGTFNVDDVGYATAAAAGLNGGDITPTGASVGTKQGFSIIEFTGSASGTPSISHGLSEAPNFIIQKDTGATTSWRVFMYNGTTWSIMNFDDASGAQGATETAPTSSLFYANGNGNAANTQIAYLWHDVPGLQKFGTFEGNGNANGPFIELGFRPSLILMRNLDNYGTNYDWCMYDNERANFNPNDKFLAINLAKADNVRGDNSTDNARYVDFLSNGFKIRNTASTLNLNSHTIFYAAWAEVPAFNLYGAQSNAR